MRRWGLESSRFDERYEISGLGGLSGVRWCLHTAYKNAKYQQKILKSCCCSLAQSCLTLCDLVDCGTPGLPVLHHFLKLAQTHVHWVCDAIQPSRPLSAPSPPAFKDPASGSFLMSWLFTSGAQSIGASASASVLPMNIQDWFPLGGTGLISLQSKGLLRIFSPTPQLKSMNSSVLSFLYGPTRTSIHDYWKTIASTRRTFVGKVMSLLFNLPSRFVVIDTDCNLLRNNRRMRKTQSSKHWGEPLPTCRFCIQPHYHSWIRVKEMIH